MPRLERVTLVAMAVLVLLLLALAAQLILPSVLPTNPTRTQLGQAENQVEILTARVVEVREQGTVELAEGIESVYQELTLYVESGSLAGQHIQVTEGVNNVTSVQRLFRPGDRVYVDRVAGPQGDHLFVSDYVRTSPLIWVGLVFGVLVIAVGLGKGLRSLVGTALSIAVIFGFIVPRIMAGDDPLQVTLVGAVFLLTASTYLIFGWNTKAHAAIIGMMISLVCTGLLAGLFVGWTRLYGLGSEETSYLILEFGAGINLQGLLLAGIIIGSLGVLDDVCVSQASAVFELSAANPKLRWWELLRHSLNIGRDHISSSVNTLMLAYVGASMPLFLAFTLYQEPLLRRLNREPIAEEIVRTLVGSIGLVLAVPITSVVASLMAEYDRGRSEEQLQRLLTLLQEGKTRRLVDIAAALEQQPAAVQERLEELAERGYLRLMSGECPSRCEGCPFRLPCVAGYGDQVWTLSARGAQARLDEPAAERAG